jgi:hypothetical protein
MTKSLPLNTITALGLGRTKGLVIRDFVTIRAKDRTTGDIEELCLWNGFVPITAPVTKPSDGSSDSRVFQAAGTLLSVQSIPAGMQTEVRTIRVRLSKLSPVALNIIRTYDAKMAPIEIHRGLFDTESHQLVDPALCRFDGYINNAPIKTPKAGSEGYIEVECVSRSRILTRTSGMLFSMETLKRRSSDLFGKYLDVSGAWRIWWGQEEKELGTKKNRPKERFMR